MRHALLTLVLFAALAAGLGGCNISDEAPLFDAPATDDAGDDAGLPPTSDADPVEPEPDAATPPTDAGADAGGDTGSDVGLDASTDADDDSGDLPADCDDGVRNGDETDIDCGGSCGPCMPGMACLTQTDCGIDTFGTWSECESGGEVCGDTGVKTRTVTTRSCQDDVCVRVDTEETQPCPYDSAGDECASPVYGPWSLCTAPDVCDETGSRTREVTTYACAGGACQPITSDESQICNRTTDGRPCQTNQIRLPPAGGQCDNGVCRTFEGPPCSSDLDCGPDAYCTSENWCCPSGMLCPI